MTDSLEDQFTAAVADMLVHAGVKLLKPPRSKYKNLIKGSPASEADGILLVEGATIILEIETKDYPSDNIVKYHRAISLSLLNKELLNERMALVQAFVRNKNIKPLRIENSKYMGSLLNRDLGICFISADSERPDIRNLAEQIKDPLLTFLQKGKS